MDEVREDDLGEGAVGYPWFDELELFADGGVVVTEYSLFVFFFGKRESGGEWCMG
jgi:hypothetical protein